MNEKLDHKLTGKNPRDKIILTPTQKAKIKKILSCEESAHFNPKELHPTEAYSEVFHEDYEHLTKEGELYTKSKEELIGEMITDVAEDRYHERMKQEKQDKKHFKIFWVSFSIFVAIVVIFCIIVANWKK